MDYDDVNVSSSINDNYKQITHTDIGHVMHDWNFECRFEKVNKGRHPQSTCDSEQKFKVEIIRTIPANVAWKAPIV